MSCKCNTSFHHKTHTSGLFWKQSFTKQGKTLVILLIKIYYETKSFLCLAFIHNTEDFTPWTLNHLNQIQPFDSCLLWVLAFLFIEGFLLTLTTHGMKLWILMFVDIYRGLVLSGVCHTHKGCIVCITRYAYKYLSSYLEHKSEYGDRNCCKSWRERIENDLGAHRDAQTLMHTCQTSRWRYLFHYRSSGQFGTCRTS